jgi:hypothetical protein
MPACLGSGRCTRMPGFPLREMLWKEQRLISPDNIRARVVLLYCCSALILQNDLIDPAYGLAMGFSEQAHFGALVTTWRPTIDDPHRSLANSFINSLSDGIAVGMALHKFHNSYNAVTQSISLCLIGDPMYRVLGLEASRKFPISDVAIDRPHSRKTYPTERNQRKGLRELLFYLASFDTFQYDKELLVNAVSQLDKLAVSEKNDEKIVIEDSVGETILKFFSGTPWLEKKYDGLGSVAAVEEGVICKVCHGMALRYSLAFPASIAISNRIIINCASCGEVHNMPDGMEFDLDHDLVRTGLLAIPGVPIDAKAIVCLLNHDATMNLNFSWPRKDGRLLRTFKIPQDLPLGPVLCKVLVYWNFELFLIGTKFVRLNAEILITSKC